MAHAVVVAGVEEGDPGLDRRMDRGDALATVRRTVEIGHAHAAEAEGADRRTVLAERAGDHRATPPVVRCGSYGNGMTDVNICHSISMSGLRAVPLTASGLRAKTRPAGITDCTQQPLTRARTRE